MIPKITLETVRMSALREKVKFYALLFDIPIHTVQIEVQGTFKTREDTQGPLAHCLFHGPVQTDFCST